MDQSEHSPVGATSGTMAGQLSSRPVTDDTLFVRDSLVLVWQSAPMRLTAEMTYDVLSGTLNSQLPTCWPSVLLQPLSVTAKAYSAFHLSEIGKRVPCSFSWEDIGRGVVWRFHNTECLLTAGSRPWKRRQEPHPHVTEPWERSADSWKPYFYIQGVPEKMAQSLRHHILQPHVTESCGFQLNVQK